MSFYRPPDGTLPSLQEEDAHEYSTIANGGGKNNDARVIVEAVTSPRATSQPLTVAQPSLKQVDFAQPQPKKRANATRFIIPPEDCKNWTETYVSMHRLISSSPLRHPTMAPSSTFWPPADISCSAVTLPSAYVRASRQIRQYTAVS